MLKRNLLFCLLVSMTSCHRANPVSPPADNPAPPVTIEDNWVTRADMPTARGYFCGEVVDGKIYLIGGAVDLSHSSDAVEVYDPQTDQWTAKKKMPEQIVGLAAAELDGKIYTFGGRTGNVYSGMSLNHTYVYDPAADTWTRKADMPTPRAFLSASVIDGKIYAVGGATTGYHGLTDVQMYDPATDTWTSKASLRRPKALFTASVFAGKIYLIGGGDAPEGDVVGTAFPDFDVYDPTNDSWNSGKDIAQARLGHGSGVIKERLYICGGFTSDSSVLFDLSEYDINSDKWSGRSSMPSARRCFVPCVCNGKLFIFGGISGSAPATILKSVIAYTPLSSN